MFLGSLLHGKPIGYFILHFSMPFLLCLALCFRGFTPLLLKARVVPNSNQAANKESVTKFQHYIPSEKCHPSHRMFGSIRFNAIL